MVIARTLPARVGSVVGIALLYVVCTVPLLSWRGPAFIALAILAVVAVAAFFGLRLGLAATLLCLPLNTLLLLLLGYSSWDTSIRNGDPLAIGKLLLVGLFVGALRVAGFWFWDRHATQRGLEAALQASERRFSALVL